MRTLRLIIFCQLMLWPLRVTAQAANDVWVDKSPHKELSVKVNGINLEYLDWGGNGEALVFLAGLGNTAHIFDDIAPQFTDHFHVLGLTRRGFGRSDKPATGYDGTTLVEDLRQFLDALKINHVILAGHSFAALELTEFAELYPDRVDKLVYFDNGYNFNQPGTIELLGQIDAFTPHPSSADRANLTTMLQWCRTNRPGWNAACEADLREGYAPGGATPDSIDQMLMKAYFAAPKDISKLQAPVLAFFADHRLDKILADANDADRDKVRQVTQSAKEWWRNQIDNFKRQMKNATVVELPDTDHFCFIQRQDEVVRQMKLFLEQN